MITFACVLFTPARPVTRYSQGYDGAWVDKLYRGVCRNYDGEFDFVCLHDDHEYVFEESAIRRERLISSGAGWLPMMEVWRSSVAAQDVVVLGLDTVIVGDITGLFDGYDIGLLRDPYAQSTICNGVGVYSRSAATWLWTEYEGNMAEWLPKMQYMGRPSEMAYLREMVGIDGCTLLDEEHPGKILSYKASVRGKRLPSDPRIIYFHGDPKPPSIPEEWILEHWI